MIDIRGILTNKSPLHGLIRIGDIIHFEGPLLTLYQSQRGKLFLCDWVDRDNQNNRWLKYRTTALAIYQFIHGTISHRELFRTKYTKGEFWSFEVNKELEHHHFYKIDKDNLPELYLPNPDSFFEPSDCPQLKTIEIFTGRAILTELGQKVAYDVSDTLNKIEPLNKDNDLKNLKVNLLSIVKDSIDQYEAHGRYPQPI